MSLITERLVQLLRLLRNQSVLLLNGIGSQGSNKTKGITSFSLQPHYDSSANFKLSAHIVPKLTLSLPSMTVTNSDWQHLEGLTLADPHYLSPSSIDLILGVDVYQIIEEGLIKGSKDMPVAQLTKLGWIISGPTNSTSSTDCARSYHVSADQELHNLLQQFWEIDKVPTVKSSHLSSEEQDCENHFQTTHRRDSSGRYIVYLPFKHSVEKLGDSKVKATCLSTRLSSKLSSNPTYALLYKQFMTEYEQLHHMQRVSSSVPEPLQVYYLPHHGVWKENSLTTKLRVVFNGSSRTTSGYSLNDLLHTGAKLQTDLFDVLIWFRLFRYVFATDVEKMYRQI